MEELVTQDEDQEKNKRSQILAVEAKKKKLALF